MNRAYLWLCRRLGWCRLVGLSGLRMGAAWGLGDGGGVTVRVFANPDIILGRKLAEDVGCGIIEHVIQVGVLFGRPVLRDA